MSRLLLFTSPFFIAMLLAAAGCKPRPSEAAAAASPPSSSATLTTASDLGGRRVVVAVENGYVPFNYIRTDNQKAEGWDYDAVAEVGRRLNFRPEFREIAWDSLIQGVATGQFDLAANGITITEERARVVDFSVPYMKVNQRLLVRAGERRFDSLKTFAATASARLGAQKGNTNYTKAEELAGTGRVVAFDGFGELIQALLSQDVDAVVIDDVGGQGYVGAHRGELRLLEGSLPGQDLGFVFPKGSPLRAPVDAALTAMKADGTLARLNAKWFAPDFVPPAAPVP